MMNPPNYSDAVPYLTANQMVEVDRMMIEDYKIELIQMMENAGRNLAHLARARFLRGDPRGKQVIVLAGKGGNGGGALVCARWLHNWGANIEAFTTRPDAEFTPVPAHQLGVLREMQVSIREPDQLPYVKQVDLIVDGIIGYSLHNKPKGSAAEMIRWANAYPAPILALDVPSGIDTTTGTIFDPAIQADATMTLALPKEGLRAPGVEEHVGELYLADISVPPELFAKMPLNLQVAHIFAQSDIVRLR